MEKYYVSVELMNLKQKIVNTINESPLSYCLKKVVIDELAGAVREAAEQEYQRDLAELEKIKNESAGKKDDTKEG